MPYNHTAVGLCSSALVRLGAEAISTFEENTTESIIASAIYPSLKRTYLTRHPWRFTLKFVTLTYLDVNTAPEEDGGEFDYCYNLPSDCLLVYGLESRYTFRTFGNRLYTDDDAAKVLYGYDAEETEFPEYFQNALIWQLAAEMCYPVTADRAHVQFLEAKANKELTFARHIDSKSTTPVGLTDAIYEILRAHTTARV